MLDTLSDIISAVKKAGADHADALMAVSDATSASVLNGRTESVERDEDTSIGLRVFVGQKIAVVSGNRTDRASIDALIERAIGMAGHAPPDPYAALTPADEIATEFADLDLVDSTEISAQQLIARAQEAEETGLRHPDVSASSGAGAAATRSQIAIVTSNGYARSYESTSHSLGLSLVAGSGTGMFRDHAQTGQRHLADCDSPAEIGRMAAERTACRLNPRKPSETGNLPVVFDPRVSGSIIGGLCAALNGASVARGGSFLKESLHKQVLPEHLTLTDDPLRLRGLRSRPADAEGRASRIQNFIEDGRITGWLTDNQAAAKLGMASTASASRSIGGGPGPGPTNLHLAGGAIPVSELIGDIQSGFYITGMIGHGLNLLTGDYSRGADGFRIENGEITHAVTELTVAGRLQDMLPHMIAADDLDFRYAVNAPTLRFDNLTVA